MNSNKTVGVGAILETQDGNIILQLRDYNTKNMGGNFSLFGGGKDSNEQDIECLRRELDEELGVKLSNYKFLDQVFHMSMYHSVYIVYIDLDFWKFKFTEGAGFLVIKKTEIPAFLKGQVKNPFLEVLLKYVSS